MPDYLKLQNNVIAKIRVVSNIIHKNEHWVRENGRMRVRDCAGANCQYCQQGIRKYDRYGVEIVDRADNKNKFLNFGSHLYKKIKDAFGEVGTTNCDLHILKIVRNHPFIEYSVTPVLGVDPIKSLVVEGGDPDICPSCGASGKQHGMACICLNCGKIIWGC